MTPEPRRAKQIALVLGVLEFLFGLIAVPYLMIRGVWIDSDPRYEDNWLWPSLLIVSILMILGPVLTAWVAQRTSNRGVVMICNTLLIVYPLSILVWSQSNG